MSNPVSTASTSSSSSSSSGVRFDGTPSMATLQTVRSSESLLNSIEKINSELLSLTYGALVVQLLKDYNDISVVNGELEKMGQNMGVRLVDEFLAKTQIHSCTSFKDTIFILAKLALKMFLGVNADIAKWREDGRAVSLIFKGNPLHEFVDLPTHLHDLQYGALLCGAIRGALSALSLVVECSYVRSELKGQNESEIRIVLKEVLQEQYQDEEEA